MRQLIRVFAIAAPLCVLGSGAFADEPCSGTLCDLFHGSSDDAAAPTAPAAPHVMTVPSNPLAKWFGHGDSTPDTSPAGAAAAQSQPAQQPTSYGNSFFHMGGGGVANRNSSGDCSGTVCDLYHGHANSDEAEPTTIQDINGIPQSSFDRAAAPSVQSVAVTAPASVSRPAPVAYARPAPLPATAPSCPHSAKDPWSCFRR